MENLAWESLFFAYALARHMVVMMYWVWVPGFIVSAVVALRWREAAAAAVRQNARGGMSPVLWGVLLGITSSPHRRKSLNALLELLREGVSPAGAFAAYLASRNLVPYFLVVWMLLLGLEFAVGQVIGALAMIVLVAAGLPYAIPEEAGRRPLPLREAGSASIHVVQGETSFRELLLRTKGWGKILKHIGGETLGFAVPLAAGILAGGFILAAGLRPWCVELESLGGGGTVSDFLNALIGPGFSLVAAVGPMGSLPVASSLFKAYALGYPGLVAFVLAGAIKPQDIVAFRRAFSSGAALRLAALLYLSAGAGGLAATAVFALFGFRPGHVPLFRELVDAIIMRVVPGMGGM